MIDLTTGGAETTIFPDHTALRNYLHVIVLGTIPRVERHRNIKDKNDIMASMNIFEDAKSKMLAELNSKYANPMSGTLPSLERYY